MRNTIIFILVFSSLSYSQQKKYLVSPNQEVIPIDKGTTEKLMNQYRASHLQPTFDPCNSKPVYGFTSGQFWPDQNFGFYHKDVCGQWYVIPADGTIDTVYFHTLANVGPSPVQWPGTMDSTVIFRILKSNITPFQGPGVRPGPYRPPCTSWGYYVNSNDAESGVAAFADEATPQSDSSWYPTNMPPSGTDAVASFPPFGPVIWGIGGYSVKHIKPNTDGKIVMNDLAPLNVSKGDVIFITFKIPSTIALDDNTQDIRFEIAASDQNAPYPSRDWKFYEHDSGPSNCAGVDKNLIKRGWVPRGGLDSDTLSTFAFNIWFAMTPTSNTPPEIPFVEQIHNTTSTAPQRFVCTIFDCDIANPAQAGVQSAIVKYTLDSNTAHSVWIQDLLQYDGNDQYEYTLPGVNPTRWVYYKVIATDSAGATDSSGIYSYKVVSLSNGWYQMVTVPNYTPAKLTPGGHVIDTTQWFIAPRSYGGTNTPHRGNDGTAGPFTISNGFVYFGDTMHYVWIGVDGAIALSKTATDTIDVNSNGFPNRGFDFPYPQLHNRLDTFHLGDMPKAFIAPYWADWVNKQDSPLATFGHVRYNDDSDKFTVEWDSLGDIDQTVFLALSDIDMFRVVLDKTDNSLEFQYDDIGYGGLDTMNLTGIQCDSNYHPQPVGQYPPFVYYNKNGYPTETHLHSGLCIKYLAVLITLITSDGWNLLSLPAVFPNDSVSVIFPCHTGPAFIIPCEGGYTPSWTVDTGQGFWLKFSGTCLFPVIGRPLTHLDIFVCPGWNLIGTGTVPIPVANITPDPATGIGPSSTFFYYSSPLGYNVATSLYPGLGYWVRSIDSGHLHLEGTNAPKTGNPFAELNALDKITISQKSGGGQTLYIGSGSFDPDKYQMPPRAPEGALDVRFASNRMVELYPSTLEDGKKYEYPIMISATQYPLTIRWERAWNSTDQPMLLLKTDDGKVLASLNGSGKITLNDASVKKLIVAVNAGIAIPKVFALSKNYPNPFNPTTQFTISVPKTSQLDVSVYDILGRKIITLWNGEQSAGYHTMEWDGRDGQGLIAPTGMYFIRMNVPDEKFSAVQKVLLMK